MLTNHSGNGRTRNSEPTRTAASYFAEAADAVTAAAVGADLLDGVWVAVAVSAVSFEVAGAPFADGADLPGEAGAVVTAVEGVCVDPGMYVSKIGRAHV